MKPAAQTHGPRQDAGTTLASGQHEPGLGPLNFAKTTPHVLEQSRSVLKRLAGPSFSAPRREIFDGSKTFSVEPKYDGERIMAHIDVEAGAALARRTPGEPPRAGQADRRAGPSVAQHGRTATATSQVKRVESGPRRVGVVGRFKGQGLEWEVSVGPSVWCIWCVWSCSCRVGFFRFPGPGWEPGQTGAGGQVSSCQDLSHVI